MTGSGVQGTPNAWKRRDVWGCAKVHAITTKADEKVKKAAHYTLVAGGHLRRMEEKGLVRRVRVGTGASGKTVWEVVAERTGELFG